MKEKECLTCHKIKPLIEFDVRNDGGNITYRNQCHECRRNYRRNWESNHKEHRKQKHHEWYLKAKQEGKIKTYGKVQREKKEKYIRMLGGKCQNPKCSTPNGYNKCLAALEFHHINPEDKNKKDERHGYLRKEFEKLILEGKIQLLCANCHREKHYEEK